jgi:ABC-type uncharacterized transport system permease subunit
MLVAAFVGAAIASLTGSAAFGLGAGIAAGLLLALLHGTAAIAAGGDQIVSGMALNLIAAGGHRASLRRGSGNAARRHPCRTGPALARSHCPLPSR